jgi:uncharacterized protein
MAYTFVEAAIDALRTAPHPLDRMELWSLVEKRGLDQRLKTKGKTPWETLAARVYVDTKENPQSPFVRVGSRPVRFWLREKPLPPGWEPGKAFEHQELAGAEPKGKARKRGPQWLERELHPLLAHFAMEQMEGTRTKTIRHPASKRDTFGEWVHPDMLGVKFPMSALEAKQTLDLAGAMSAPLLRLYSFELKRQVNFQNLREAFFQAVSNSSWAHEGYLVAAHFREDDEFLDELRRLAQGFGIGAIRLDLNDVGNSSILIPARQREHVDWATLDKLCTMNPDVAEFLEHVRIDLAASRIHDSEYDAVPEDAVEYAAKLLKAER